MNTFQKIGGLLVAALMAATALQASSSANGAPGRSDFNKRKNTGVWKSKKDREAAAPLKSDAPAAGRTESAPAPSPRVPAHNPEAVRPSPSAITAAPVSASEQKNSRPADESTPAASPASEIADNKIAPAAPPSNPPAAVAKVPASVPVPAPQPRPAAATVTLAPAAPAAEVSEAALKVSYADVLNDRQKAVLKERAGDLNLKEDDYDKLLSPDEKERLDQLVRERRRAMATGE